MVYLCDLKLRNKVSLYVTLKGVYMLPFFILKSRVPKMKTMMIKTVIAPDIPPITAYNLLDDVSWIAENKQKISDNNLNYPHTPATTMTICDS